MELIDYLRMLRRQWLWVVGSVVVLTALAAVYVSVAPKSYRATADIYILGTVPGDPQNVNDAAQSASKYVFDNIDTLRRSRRLATGDGPGDQGAPSHDDDAGAAGQAGHRHGRAQHGHHHGGGHRREPAEGGRHRQRDGRQPDRADPGARDPRRRSRPSR